MINQAMNIANLYRQAKFEYLDPEEKLSDFKSKAERMKQFYQELNQQGK